MKNVGVVILNYNNIKDTINCILSVMAFGENENLKIVVVDNYSSVNVRDSITSFVSGFKGSLFFTEEMLNKCTNLDLPLLSYLQLNQNKGYACGNNEGTYLLSKDLNLEYLMILNTDVLLIENIVSPMISFLEKESGAMVVTPLKLKKDRKTVDSSDKKIAPTFSFFLVRYMLLGFNFSGLLSSMSNRFDVHYENPGDEEIQIPLGACLFFRWKDWILLRGFDPHTFLYMEENILSEKIRLLGSKIYILKDIKCVHLGGMSTPDNSSFTAKCWYNSLIYYFSSIKKVSTFSLFLLRLFGHLTLCRINVTSFIKRYIKYDS